MLAAEIQPDRHFVRTSNWYVIFVKTFEEYRFAERLQDKLDATKYVVFVPTKDRSFRKKQIMKLHRVLLFPGYVFVASNDASERCFEILKPLIIKDGAVYKLLGDDGNLNCAVVGEQDKVLLMRLMNKEFHIPALEAVGVGDKVEIADGLFEGFEGYVKKINKYRQTVDVEFTLFNRTQAVTFAMAVVGIS